MDSAILKNRLSGVLGRRGYLYWLNSPEAERDLLRMEQRLAYARAVVISACFLLMWFVPTEAPVQKGLASSLLLAYLGYSIFRILWLRRTADKGRSHRFASHVIDLLVVISFFTLTQGPNDPSYVLLFFVLAAAGVRWAHWETFATAVAAGVLIFLEAIFFNPHLLQPGDLNRAVRWSFISHTGYILTVAFLMGMLSEASKRLGAERALMERLLRCITKNSGFQGTMLRISAEMMRVFGCRKILIAAREGLHGPLFLWQVERDNPEAHIAELDPGAMDVYFFPDGGSSHFVDKSEPLALPSRPGGETESAHDRRFPEQFQALHPFRSLLTVTQDLGKHRSLRTFFLDPAPVMSGPVGKRVGQAIMQQLAVPMYDQYLLWQMSARAGETERERIALEIHDGPVQSLIATEIRVQTLRRKLAALSPEVEEWLALLQQQLRSEVLRLRDLMKRLQSVEGAPEPVVDLLADVAARFQHSTGIVTNFDSDVDEMCFSGNVRRELVRVLQEALINVRKHSGADAVAVSLKTHDGSPRLVISDNGCGLDFVGRYSLDQLCARCMGPEVIKERVRLMGGDLAIESSPERGTRLEILLPPN